MKSFLGLFCKYFQFLPNYNVSNHLLVSFSSFFKLDNIQRERKKEMYDKSVQNQPITSEQWAKSRHFLVPILLKLFPKANSNLLFKSSSSMKIFAKIGFQTTYGTGDKWRRSSSKMHIFSSKKDSFFKHGPIVLIMFNYSWLDNLGICLYLFERAW